MSTGCEMLPRGAVHVEGELRERLLRNFDRLERSEYEPGAIFPESEWPGDLPGRVILTVSRLVGVTGRRAKYLDEIVEQLPKHLNREGYLGKVSDLIDEQQLSGHGWLVSGLVEYYQLTGSKPALQIAERMATNLFLRLRGKMQTYPRRPEQRVFAGGVGGNLANTAEGWVLSTDIGCAFIALEGLVRAARVLDQDDMKSLVGEMFEVFRTMDLMGISAQLHASLTAARTFLQHYATVGDPALLELAKKVYELFRTEAITENYANYNWFRRPTWNEPCAIVDSFALALDLWRHTGEARYIDDAHHIYYNALGYAQKPHGGFGCDSCAGAEATFMTGQFYDVVGCCNMRGGVGLSHAVEYSYLQSSDAVAVPFLFGSRAEVAFGDGRMALKQTTGYPLEGRVTLTIEASTLRSPKALRLFVPSWATDVKISVNGRNVPVELADGFATVRSQWTAGDRVETTFPVGLRTQPVMNHNNLQGLYTYRHGPLILGTHLSGGCRDREGLRMQAPGRYVAPGPNGITLSPINDTMGLTDDVAKHDRRKILFR